MRIETLNGMPNVNGLSRVNPINGLSRVNLNGLSRVNLNATYSLNDGFTLNGFELNAYLDECAMYGEYPTMNGLKDWWKKRQANKQAKKEGRQLLRADKRQNRKEFWGGLKDAAVTAAESLKGGISDFDLMEIGGQMLPAELTNYLPADSEEMDTKGLFKPKFNPLSGKWWTNSRVPVMQKVGVGAVGLVGIDALTGGHILLQRVGVMKPKKKK